MCLVEVEGSRLMQPACSYKAADNLVVRTQTSRVERNRQFILSLHLADTIEDRAVAEDNNPSKVHDLVDVYGTAGSWPSVEQQRAGRPDDDNPFIAYRPDRCILCSLCTRYCDQVEAVSAITLASRGAETTIATADARPLTDTTCELCGGCVDVCPTGAMTEKPALAYGKPERELEKVRSTCNFCGVGCQVDLNVDRESNRVVKVTSPPPGTTVNDGNLCVKGRFANDFIHHSERLSQPLVRGADGELHPASWDEALDRAVDRLRQLLERIGGHVLARLVAAALHQFHRQVAQVAVAGRALGLLLRRFAVTLDADFLGLALVRLVAAEQGVETLAETAFTLCRHSRCLYLMPGIAGFAERPWHFAWPVRAAGFRPPAPGS